MDIPELQRLATRTRFMREAGVAIVIGSLVLGAFLFIPLAPERAPAPVAVSSTSNTAPDAFSNVPIEAKAAVVYDLTTKQVLYAKNADAQLPLASLTKLLTVYGALAQLSPTTPITIPADTALLTPPRALSPGEQFALNDLARITLTASLNDGAAAIAEAAAASENTNTVSMMAGAAASLDLAETYAVNGNGLDVSASFSGGYGSAYDIAVLAGALLNKAPAIAGATTLPTASAVSSSGKVISVKNTDPVVRNVPGLLLSKTGYTDLAGGNLALVFDAGLMHPVAVVVLGSTKDARFTDGQALVAATFAHFAGVKSL